MLDIYHTRMYLTYLTNVESTTTPLLLSPCELSFLKNYWNKFYFGTLDSDLLWTLTYSGLWDTLDLWTSGSLNLWTSEPLDLWTSGSLVLTGH